MIVLCCNPAYGCNTIKRSTLVDPKMTLDGNYALSCIHTCVSEPTTKIYMKIDPYYQRRKCSPGILVSSKKFYGDIPGGFAGDWASNESGMLKMAIFASFARCVFRTFTSKAAFIILCYVAH